MFKKTLKSAVALGMAVLTMVAATPVFAAEGDGTKVADGVGSTPVYLTAEATDFSVEVPLALHVKMLKDGSIQTPDSDVVYIENLSPAGGVVVNKVTVTPSNDYELKAFDTTDFGNITAGTKAYGFKINNELVNPADGLIAMDTANWPTIPAKSTFNTADEDANRLNITYEAKLPAQKAAIEEDLQIGQVTFEIAWAE